MIRSKKIDIVLKTFQDNKLKEKFIKYLYPFSSRNFQNTFLINWCKSEKEIKKLWKLNPDLRLQDVLYSNAILDDKYLSNDEFHGWEIDKEDEFFIKNKIKERREILLWGLNDGGKINYTLIKDIKTDDIKHIVKSFENGTQSMNYTYMTAFGDELFLRKKDNKKSK